MIFPANLSTVILSTERVKAMRVSCSECGAILLMVGRASSNGIMANSCVWGRLRNKLEDVIDAIVEHEKICRMKNKIVSPVCPSKVYQLVTCLWEAGEPSIVFSSVVYLTKEKALSAIPDFILQLAGRSDDPITSDDVMVKTMEVT